MFERTQLIERATTIDLSRTTIIVEGHQCDEGCNEISATVPKIFTHGDSLYVFYDVFLTGDLGSIGQRGVEGERPPPGGMSANSLAR